MYDKTGRLLQDRTVNVNQPAVDFTGSNAGAVDDEKPGNGPSTCLRVGPTRSSFVVS